MPLIVGTAGHIDHGKTSLVRALTGQDTDRLDEEKARGISIDLGFAWLDAPGGERVGIVDVPGHERFIRNMLAGAHGIDKPRDVRKQLPVAAVAVLSRWGISFFLRLGGITSTAKGSFMGLPALRGSAAKRLFSASRPGASAWSSGRFAPTPTQTACRWNPPAGHLTR